MKYAFILTLFLILTTHQLSAQVYCKNGTSMGIWLVLAYNYVPPGVETAELWTHDTWISEGWFFIPAGKTVQVSTHVGYDTKYGIKTNYFYFATHDRADGRDWYGNRKLLYDNTAPKNADRLSFRIEKANSKNSYQDVPNLVGLPFKLVKTIGDAPYTIELDMNTPNDEFVEHDAEWESQFK